MALNTVTVTWNEVDIGQANLAGWVSFQLSENLADQTDGLKVNQYPAKSYHFVNSTGSSDPLVANDNANLAPTGSYYTITVTIANQQPYSFMALLNFANGATQTLSFLYANQAQPTGSFSQYMPLPTGTPTAGQVPIATGAGEASAWANLPTQNYGNVFGDGSDGAVTLDGVTTYPFGTLAGNVYTITRDIWATNLTINNGITLKGAYAIYCRGTLTNNGIILGPSNAGTAAGTAGGATSSGTLGFGGAGGAGTTGAGASPSGGTRPGVGNGGNGGAGSGNAGGTGATTNATGTQWYKHPLMVVSAFSGIYAINGGFGGAGGGGDGTNPGGGGGSGAGPIWIAAWAVINNGQMNAIGGAGGTPTAGNAGGGGGGGGGLVLIYTLAAWTNNGTVSVAGGAAGSGHGTGAAGVAGSTGSIANFVLL